MNNLKKIKEVIYHELGHVLVYILANSNKDTYICNIEKVLLGNINIVVPIENLYYYELLKPTDHIAENSKNIERTLCWIILQFSGCLFESHYEKSEFNICFCSKRESSGKKDYDNLYYFKYYSSGKISDVNIERLRNRYISFLESKNIFSKMSNYLTHFLSVFGSNDFFQFADEDLEILLEEIKDWVIDKTAVDSFHKLILEESRHYN